MNRRQFIFNATLLGGLTIGGKLLALPKKPVNYNLTNLHILTDEPRVALEIVEQYIPHLFSKSVLYREFEMVGNFVGDIVASNNEGIINYKQLPQDSSNLIASIGKKLNLPRNVSNPILLTFTIPNLSRPESVLIFSDSKLIEKIPLNSEERIRIASNSGELYANISDGKVWAEGSSCRHKNCEHQGKIHRVGEQIICIPNRIRIELWGKTKYDAATY